MFKRNSIYFLPLNKIVSIMETNIYGGAVLNPVYDN
jgi:hypothetical protein